MKKKLVTGILMVIMVLTGFFNVAFAESFVASCSDCHDLTHTADFNIMSEPCSVCGARTVKKYDYKDWVYSGFRACVHRNYGVDYLYERLVIEETKCTECSWKGYYTYTEHGYICDGWN